jgi:ribosomal protein L16/L10AE
MNLCIKIPSRLKFKRFNKNYAKIRYSVNHCKSNVMSNSSQFVCAIKALNHGFLTSKLLNSLILLLRRAVGKGRAGWPRVRISFNLRVPVTRKSSGHRMGKGKGAVKYWGVPIKAGSFVFKIQKSPRKSFFFSNFAWTNLYSFFEFLDTTSFVYDNLFRLYKKYNITEALDLYEASLQLIKTNIIYIGFSRFLFLKYLNFLLTILLLGKIKVNKGLKKKTLILQQIRGFVKQYKCFLKNRLIGLQPPVHQLLVLLCFYFTHSRFTFICKFMKKKLNKVNLKFFFRDWNQNLTMLRTLQCDQKSPTDIDEEMYDVPYFENRLLAQYTQTYSSTKISYLPALYRGLKRVKKKLPFPSEIYFVDQKSFGFSFYKAITDKRKRLKHLKQR